MNVYFFKAAEIKQNAMELIAKNEDLLNEVADQRQEAQDLLDSGIKHQQVIIYYVTFYFCPL